MDLLKAIGRSIFNSSGQIALLLGMSGGAALLIIYMNGGRPAEPEVLKVAFSESGCVKVELEEASAKGQVITKSMLEESLNRCRVVQGQRAAF